MTSTFEPSDITGARRRSGFSLLEMMIALGITSVVILGLLSSLTFFSKARWEPHTMLR